MKAFATSKEQFVVNSAGRPVAVLLDLPAYRRLREAAEDNADVRAFDAVHPRVAAEIRAGRFLTLSEYRARRAHRRR